MLNVFFPVTSLGPPPSGIHSSSIPSGASLAELAVPSPRGRAGPGYRSSWGVPFPVPHSTLRCFLRVRRPSSPHYWNLYLWAALRFWIRFLPFDPPFFSAGPLERIPQCPFCRRRKSQHQGISPNPNISFLLLVMRRSPLLIWPALFPD